jgi:CRP-like cAMP-binding protein
MEIPVQLRRELLLGQCKLSTIFRKSAPRILKPRDIMGTATGLHSGIYYLRAGWACQFRDSTNGHRAIVDVYLPGDVIGLDTLLYARQLEDVLALSSVAIEPIHGEGALLELMADRPTALYLTWLLGQSQRRLHRLLAAISGLDARGRIAMMALDFHARLRRRKLITGLTYNLPLTQVQIGNYLGLTVVHINRVLRSLRDERIVNLEKHCVTIFSLERLTSLAQNGGIASSKMNGGNRQLNEAAN